MCSAESFAFTRNRILIGKKHLYHPIRHLRRVRTCFEEIYFTENCFNSLGSFSCRLCTDSIVHRSDILRISTDSLYTDDVRSDLPENRDRACSHPLPAIVLLANYKLVLPLFVLVATTILHFSFYLWYYTCPHLLEPRISAAVIECDIQCLYTNIPLSTRATYSLSSTLQGQNATNRKKLYSTPSYLLPYIPKHPYRLMSAAPK